MKKFDGILFTTDLDGTLLRRDKTISNENIEAIKYFKDEGGIFTFVTGRATVGAARLHNIICPNAPCGCLNGGSVYDFEKKQLLWSVEMPRKVLELLEYVDKTLPDIGIEIHTHQNIYFCKTNSAVMRHKSNEVLPDLFYNYNDVSEPFAKILFADDSNENLLKLIDALNAHPLSTEFDFVRSDLRYYEVLPKGANKGKLVEIISNMLGINIEKTIAVGDNDNDISMLKTAYIGFAVENASPGAKAAADYITVSNEESAIARIISDIDCGRVKI